jgi:hypothetical protein
MSSDQVCDKKKRILTFRAPPDVRRLLQRASAATRARRSRLICRALRRDLAQYAKKSDRMEAPQDYPPEQPTGTAAPSGPKPPTYDIHATL